MMVHTHLLCGTRVEGGLWVCTFGDGIQCTYVRQHHVRFIILFLSKQPHHHGLAPTLIPRLCNSLAADLVADILELTRGHEAHHHTHLRKSLVLRLLYLHTGLIQTTHRFSRKVHLPRVCLHRYCACPFCAMAGEWVRWWLLHRVYQ